MTWTPGAYARDLNGGYRFRKVISPSQTAVIPEHERAPAFMVTESGAYTIRLVEESTAVAINLVAGSVYGIWIQAFTEGPSNNARIHLLYPQGF